MEAAATFVSWLLLPKPPAVLVQLASTYRQMEKLARLVLNAYKWREHLVSITETCDREFSSIRV